MAEQAYGLLAEFDSPEALIAAASESARAPAIAASMLSRLSRSRGWRGSCALPRPKISWVGLVGGFAGGGFALMMQCYVNYDFPIDVGGRPLYAISAFAVVMFELTILFSALSMIVAMLWQNGLPRLNYPLFGAKRFHRASKDRFFLCIGVDDGEFDEKETSGFPAGGRRFIGGARDGMNRIVRP